MPTIIGDGPVARRTHWNWMLRAWKLRRPRFNYRHAPDGADSRTYLRRAEWASKNVDPRPLLN